MREWKRVYKRKGERREKRRKRGRERKREREEVDELTVKPLMWLGKVAEKRRICLSLGMKAMSLSRALW